MVKAQTVRWEKVKLGNIVSFKTGKLNSNAATPNGTYPFFTCAQETFRTDTYSFDTEAVLLGGNNANGIYPLKYYKGKFDAYQRTYVIRSLDNNKLNNKYLYFALRPKLDYLQSLSTGVTTKFLTLSILNEFELELPPLPPQRKIASILSAYDDLIENNTRRIQILEEMARALYYEWFVNFRFPGHEKVKMVESKLGPIPERWRVGTLKDLVECQRDSTRAGDHLSNRVYVPIDCIPRRSLTLLHAKSWEEAKSSLQLFEENDILFGAMRPYFHKVVIAPFKGVTRTTCFVLRPHRPELLGYALLTMFQEATVKFATAHSQGATIPYAVWDGSLADMKVVLPDESLLLRFNNLVSPMLQMLKRAFPKIRNLRKTRDMLLPKLISGELDVSKLDIATEGLEP